MLKSVKVKDYMSTNLITFRPEVELFEAMSVMLHHRITGAPVVNERGVMVGMLSELDCLRSILSDTYQGEEHGGLVGDFMTHHVDTINHDVDIVNLAEIFIKGPRRRFPVLEDGKLVGQISRKDVLRAVKDFANTHKSSQKFKAASVK